jgi:hypothetical protein
MKRTSSKSKDSVLCKELKKKLQELKKTVIQSKITVGKKLKTIKEINEVIDDIELFQCKN